MTDRQWRSVFAAYGLGIVRTDRAVWVMVLTLLAGVSARLPLLFYFLLANREANRETVAQKGAADG